MGKKIGLWIRLVLVTALILAAGCLLVSAFAEDVPQITKTVWDADRKTYQAYWDGNGYTGESYILTSIGGEWYILNDVSAGYDTANTGVAIANGYFLPGDTYEIVIHNVETRQRSYPVQIQIPASTKSPLTIQSSDISICTIDEISGLYDHFNSLQSWSEKESYILANSKIKGTVTFEKEAFDQGEQYELRVSITSPSGEIKMNDYIPPEWFMHNSADCTYALFTTITHALEKGQPVEKGLYTMDLYDWTNMAYIGTVQFGLSDGDEHVSYATLDLNEEAAPEELQTEAGVPILIMKEVPQPTYDYPLYSDEWECEWDPNGSEGPWILQGHYGGVDADTTVYETELYEDRLKTTSEYIKPYFREPGAVYSYRIVSKGGEGPASEWTEITMPEYVNYANLSIKKLTIPTASFSKVRKGDGFPSECVLQINNPDGWWTFSGQAPYVYAISPVDNRDKTGVSGGWYMHGEIQYFDMSVSGNIMMWDDIVEEPGDYSIRIYINGAKIGEGTFTLK